MDFFFILGILAVLSCIFAFAMRNSWGLLVFRSVCFLHSCSLRPEFSCVNSPEFPYDVFIWPVKDAGTKDEEEHGGKVGNSMSFSSRSCKYSSLSRKEILWPCEDISASMLSENILIIEKMNANLFLFSESSCNCMCHIITNSLAQDTFLNCTHQYLNR